VGRPAGQACALRTAASKDLGDAVAEAKYVADGFDAVGEAKYVAEGFDAVGEAKYVADGFDAVGEARYGYGYGYGVFAARAIIGVASASNINTSLIGACRGGASAFLLGARYPEARYCTCDRTSSKGSDIFTDPSIAHNARPQVDPGQPEPRQVERLREARRHPRARRKEDCRNANPQVARGAHVKVEH